MAEEWNSSYRIHELRVGPVTELQTIIVAALVCDDNDFNTDIYICQQTFTCTQQPIVWVPMLNSDTIHTHFMYSSNELCFFYMRLRIQLQRSTFTCMCVYIILF